MTAEWQRRADELAAQALAEGEPTAWFERLFAEGAAGATTMPWDRRDPHPVLAGRAARLPAPPGRAVVPACGLGADAAFLAAAGFTVTGFDISATAIVEGRRRFPGLDLRPGDLFAPPPQWRGAFDLVVDIYTVQALPRSLRPATVAALRGLVAPGGTLLTVQAVLAPDDDPDEGPPWPLTRGELDSFAAGGLSAVAVDVEGGYWCAEFRRDEFVGGAAYGER